MANVTSGLDGCDKDLPRLARPSPGLRDSERWYVVHTRPHCEFRAEAHLSVQRFRTFLPRYAKTVRHARKLRSVVAPFFPRYLFIALDLQRDRWRSISGTFGVSALVMAGQSPLPVPPGVVESLAASCGEHSHLHLGNTLAVGDCVRVLDGPFADLVGRLVRMDGSERVQVLLSLLGGEVPVSMERAALMLVRAA
jgi:transcription elongation factor/antiterminator RfaH